MDCCLRVSIGTAVIGFALAGTAFAQARADCQTARRGIGFAFGRSSPYFEPTAGLSAGPGSVLSRGGYLFSGRVDLPIAGAWRARVEGAATRWELERQIYSADLRQTVATETAGHINVRQIVASAGRQGGRAPVCWYVLAGGGLYSLGYQDTRYWNPGFALTAGIEFPVGDRGAVQVDAQVHTITTRSRHPIGSSAVLDGRLVGGWVYRF